MIPTNIQVPSPLTYVQLPTPQHSNISRQTTLIPFQVLQSSYLQHVTLCLRQQCTSRTKFFQYHGIPVRIHPVSDEYPDSFLHCFNGSIGVAPNHTARCIPHPADIVSLDEFKKSSLSYDYFLKAECTDCRRHGFSNV